MLFSVPQVFTKTDQLKVPQKGTVVDNQDPELKCRIKVSIPTVMEGTAEELPWVYRQRETFLGGAQNTAKTEVPNIGAQVCVVFPFGIYHPLYVGVWDNDLTISPLFFEDYPNTYGFVDDQGDFFRVNRTAGYTEYVHNSGNYILMDRSGATTVLTVGDHSEEIRGNRHVRVKGNEHIVVEGSRFVDVTGDQTTHITGNTYTQITGNQILSLTGNQEQTITGYRLVSCDDDSLLANSLTYKVSGPLQLWATGSWIAKSDADMSLYGATSTQVHSGAVTTIHATTYLDLKGDTNTRLNSGTATAPTTTSPTAPAVVVPDSPDDMASLGDIVALEGTRAPEDAEFHPTFGNPEFEQPATVKEMTDAGAPPPAPQQVDEQPPAAPPPAPVDAGQVTTGGTVDYELQLSPRFKLKHLTNDCIFKHNIPDTGWAGFTADQLVTNLKHLCVNVLEPLVDAYPGMRINCAFRKQTGKSQHPRGMAADLQWPGKNVAQMFEIAQWIKNNMNFDQLLFEHGNSAWIHVSYNKDGNRTNNTHVMSYKASGWANGKQYTSGLVCAYPNPQAIVVGGGGTIFT